MKLSKKFIIIAIGIMLIMTSIVGCSGTKGIRIESSNSSDRGVSTSPASPIPESPAEGKAKDEFGNIGSGTQSPLEPEKVITTLNLEFETTEFEKTNDELDKLITKYKGYIEYSNISYNHYYDSVKYRYGEFTIRIPKENITSFKTDNIKTLNLDLRF